MGCGRCLLLFILIVMLIIGLILLAVATVAIYNEKNLTGKCSIATQNNYTISSNTTNTTVPPTPLKYINIAHRGDTGKAQENTYEAFTSAIALGYGVEMDIFRIQTGELVLFHDINTLAKTGTNLQIEDSTLADVSKLKYLAQVNNKTYPSALPVNLFNETIGKICALNSEAIMYFDLKSVPESEIIKNIFDILNQSSCLCSAKQRFYIGTSYGDKAVIIRDEISKSVKCKATLVVYYRV